MTQPPDDAALVARLRLIVEAIAEADSDDTVGSLTVDIPYGGYPRQWLREAAQRAIRSDGWTALGHAWLDQGAPFSRAALEPSDKGVG